MEKRWFRLQNPSEITNSIVSKMKFI